MNRSEHWIAEARRSFNPGRRQPCHICGQFRSIAEAHHVVPLAEQFRRGFSAPDREHVWLCPNHHAAIHVLIDGDPPPEKLGARAAPVLADMDETAIEKIMELVRGSARWPQ